MVPELEREQRLAKARLLAQAYGQSGMTAMVPGDGDLAFGLPFLREVAQKEKLPYLCANLLDLQGKPVFPGHLIKTIHGKKVGFFGVMVKEANLKDVNLTDPIAAAQAEVAALRAEKVDLVVALSHLGSPEDRQMAQKVPGIDLILGGHSRASMSEGQFAGEVPLFQAGSRGKHVGRLVVSLVPGGKGFADSSSQEREKAKAQRAAARVQSLEARLKEADTDAEKERLTRSLEVARKAIQVPAASGKSSLAGKNRVAGSQIPLSKDLAEDGAIKALVDALKAKMPDAFKDDHGHGGGDGHQEATAAPQNTGKFRGASSCRSCHAEEFAQWNSTAHARAYTSLIKEQRHLDFDCVRCHVTGWGQPGGPSEPDKVGILRNVQCESCHGPAAEHIANPTAVKPPRVKATESQCKTCHDPSQDMGRFNYKTYLPRVDHSQPPEKRVPGSTARPSPHPAPSPKGSH